MWGFLSKNMWDKSRYFRPGINVWKIDLYKTLLCEIKENNKIILGGDVLTVDLKYTHCSWYYMPDSNKKLSDNCAQSYEVAIKYLAGFIERNGVDYYVEIVLRTSI